MWIIGNCAPNDANSIESASKYSDMLTNAPNCSKIVGKSGSGQNDIQMVCETVKWKWN